MKMRIHLVLGLVAAVAVTSCGTESGAFGGADGTGTTADSTGSTVGGNEEDPVGSDTPAGYVGLGFEDAIDRAESESREWRLASQDGEHFMLTMDYRPERINFDVEDGVVTNAWMG